MVILSFILTILVLAYATYKKKSILNSISEIAYIIPSWVFTIWLSFIGILLMPSLMTILSANLQWLGFLMIFGLFIVAASPYYRTESKILHYIGGTLSIVCATAITAILKPILLIMWTLFLIPNESWFYYMELMAFILLIITIIV